jgi:ribonuclease HI
VSETNGNKPEWLERLERVEASHVKLMTDHELFVREQERDWRQQRRRWREADKRAAELDALAKALAQQGRDVDARITNLVSAIGALAAKR